MGFFFYYKTSFVWGNAAGSKNKEKKQGSWENLHQSLNWSVNRLLCFNPTVENGSIGTIYNFCYWKGKNNHSNADLTEWTDPDRLVETRVQRAHYFPQLALNIDISYKLFTNLYSHKLTFHRDTGVHAHSGSSGKRSRPVVRFHCRTCKNL